MIEGSKSLSRDIHNVADHVTDMMSINFSELVFEVKTHICEQLPSQNITEESAKTGCGTNTPQTAQLQRTQSNNENKCIVEWKLATPDTWNVSEIKDTLQECSCLLKQKFEIEFVYLGSLVIRTIVPEHILSNFDDFKSALRSFLAKIVEVCQLDTDTPTVVKVDLNIFTEIPPNNEDQIVLMELDENQKSAVEELKDNIEKEGLDENQKSAVEELKDSIKKEGLDATFKHLEEALDKWRNEPVKLAMTGKSGVGKSSFINAIRNLKPGDPDFAITSTYGSTTKQAAVFKYPGNPKITLHDLPGYGTTKFPKTEYEEKMELHKYDYVLIFVRNIEGNDIEIARKLKEMDKPFCFVRSNLDVDIENAKNDGEPEAEVLQKIMSTSLHIFLQQGFREARFFVISNRSRRIGHFNELISYVQSNLPKLKCDAVMFSLLGELSDDIINSKYQMLKNRLWKVALASAAIAATPVPGVDVVVNVAFICKELLLYYNTFGFGQQIVIDISKHSYIRKKLSATSIIEYVASNEKMTTFVITQLGILGKVMVLQSGLDLIWPILGSVVSGLTAGAATYNLLTRILDGCRDDAKLVYSHLMIANAQN